MNNKLKILLFMGVMVLASCKKLGSSCESGDKCKNCFTGWERGITVGDQITWTSNKGETVIGKCVKVTRIDSLYDCQMYKTKCAGSKCKDQLIYAWFEYPNGDTRNFITKMIARKPTDSQTTYYSGSKMVPFENAQTKINDTCTAKINFGPYYNKYVYTDSCTLVEVTAKSTTIWTANVR